MTADTRRRWLSRLGKTALVLAALFMLLRWFEQRQTFHPQRAMEAHGSDLNRAWEDVHFSAADGVKLNAWFFPAETNSPRARFVFLVCHGNAGNISHRLPLTEALLASGAAVLAFDYRGYGLSEGRPTEAGTYLDALAAYVWLRQRGFAATNIIAYGLSLGGGVASGLAERETVGGLVLHSTFTSVPDLGAELYPWLPVRTLGRIRYDTRARLAGLRVPVLVLHSRADHLIGFQHAERNFAAAREPKLLREINGGHFETPDDLGAYQRALDEFLRVLEGRP
jgi:uncharacterized protein